jgi:hypothetical protein
MFGEGPISNTSPNVEFQGLRAQFRVDARASGQHTINWFVLKAIQFGIDVAPVSLILFAAEESLDRACPAEGKAVSVSLERTDANFGVPKEILHSLDESLTSRLPRDCVPRSDPISKLRLFNRPFEDSEDWRVAVFFTVQPSRQQRKLFRQAIKGWQTVAEFGAFGGQSISKFRGLRFEPKTESAYFDADLGHADAGLAVSLLLSVLEFFDGAVLAIEAVVFGKGEPRS